MIKRIIIASLLAVAIFTTTTACQNNFRNEIKEVEGFIKAYNDLSEIDFNDLENWTNEYTESELEDTNDNTKDGYTKFPGEILQLTKPGTNVYTGNHYYMLGHATEYYEDIKGYGPFDGMDLMRALIELEDFEILADLAIIGSESQEGWKEVKEWGSFIFYVEYIGYSNKDDMHIVKYVFQEDYHF